MDRRVLEFNGTFFETKIANHLRDLYGDSMIVIHDKKLFSQYLGKETQIDLICITNRAAFVIEAKGWRQWIKGEYSDYYWAGKSSGKDAMRVLSPINQNFIHIRALKNALRAQGYEPPEFYSVICVPDGTIINSSCKEVVNFSMLRCLIEDVVRKSEVLINAQLLCRLIDTVE